MADIDTERKFSFVPLAGRQFPSLTSKDNGEYLLKWSMKGRIQAQTFSFDQQFQVYQKNDFVSAFMQDPNVVSQLQVVSSSGKWVSLGIKATSVTAEQIPCSVISMSYFDRLEENGIVRNTGRLVKCFDEYFEDFTISDELRKMLLLEDSDNYDIYTEEERSEFLFCLFRHFCLGGSVCQFEDEITPYLDITKQVYKDLISVQKDASSGELRINSHVFKITASDEGHLFYPSDREHIQDFAYLIIDPLKRHVNVLYYNFGASDFS